MARMIRRVSTFLLLGSSIGHLACQSAIRLMVLHLESSSMQRHCSLSAQRHSTCTGMATDAKEKAKQEAERIQQNIEDKARRARS